MARTTPQVRNGMLDAVDGIQGQTVTVGSDAWRTRDMLRVLLESMGHIVIAEADGRSAVKTIQSEHPDIALIDIGLPAMSGYEVARKIREQRALDDIVIVDVHAIEKANDSIFLGCVRVGGLK